MEKSSRLPWEYDGETIVFETPEQTRVEWRIAPLGTRFVAALLDKLLIMVGVGFLLVLLILGFFAAGQTDADDAPLYVAAIVLVAWFLFSLFYFVWGEVRGEGQTWGKRRMRIRTVLATGQGVTFGASLVRNLARLVDNVPLLWLIPALTRGGRRLGDLLAGTLVVAVDSAEKEGEDKGEAQWLAPSYGELTDRRFYFSAEVTKKLYQDDLNLLEHLEQRMQSALPQQRKRTIEAVAERYIERLSLQAEEERIREDPQRFLQEMALLLRDRFEGQAY